MIRATFTTRPTRAVCFDLENRPLAYWYPGETTSEITAFGWSDGGPVHTMLLTRDGRFITDNGKRISARTAYQRFVNVLSGSDLVFGHNIRRHDLPMLNASLLRLKLPPLPEMRTTDTLRDLPRRGGMAASLEALAEMYDLGAEKHHMSPPAWERANRLTPAGLDEARLRVSSDVVLQMRLRDKLMGLGLLRDPKVWRP